MSFAAIDFTSTPLPANGQARSASAIAAAFNNIKNAYNAAVPNATSAAVASTLVTRNANGGIAVGLNAGISTAAVAALAPSTSVYAIYARVFAGGLPGIRIQDPTGATDLFTAANPANGNVTLSGQLIAGSGPTTVTDTAGLVRLAALPTVDFAHGGTGLTTAAAATVLRSTGSAWAAVAGLLAEEIVSDYRLGTNASAGVITIAAGGAYRDSNGNIVGPLGQQTVTLPAQPSGTNVQYVGISFAPTTGAPVATVAATPASLPTLVIPLANKELGYIIQRGATTNPSGVIAAADIIGARNFGSSGGGTGGSGGAPTSAAYGVYGAVPGSLTGAFDLSNPLANAFVNMALVKNAVTDASIINIIKSAVTGNVVDHVGASGGALVLTINPNSPVSVSLTGYGSRTNTSTTTSTNSLTAGSSSSGIYYLVADLTTALVSTFTTQIVSSIGAGQTALTAQYWDGNQFQLGGAGNFNAFIAYPFLPNPLVKPIAIPQQGWTPGSVMPGSAGAYTNLLIPNSTAYTVYLPLGGMRLDLALDAWVTYGTSVADFYLGAFATASAAIGATLVSSIHASAIGVATASTPVRHFYRAQLTNVGPGPVTVQPGYANGSANTAAFQVTGGQSFFWGEVNRQ